MRAARWWRSGPATTCWGRCAKREPCPKRGRRVWSLVTRGALQIRERVGPEPRILRGSGLPFTFIHPSAWKGNSQKLNFRFHDFCELRRDGVLGSWSVRSCNVFNFLASNSSARAFVERYQAAKQPLQEKGQHVG